MFVALVASVAPGWAAFACNVGQDFVMTGGLALSTSRIGMTAAAG